MNIMVYDTETSDMVDFKNPSEGPQQPHICELAAIKYDVDGNELGRFHSFVKPDGWVIAPKAAEAHGYTLEFLGDVGKPEREVLRGFIEFQGGTDLRVGHNESFDARIVRIALKRFSINDAVDNDPELAQEYRDAMADEYKARLAMCTMRLATPIVKLPGNKWPKLTEAHEYFLGVPFEGAHGAVADTEATARVFFHMLKKGYITLPDIA